VALTRRLPAAALVDEEHSAARPQALLYVAHCDSALRFQQDERRLLL
jgi:hypothetical protein